MSGQKTLLSFFQKQPATKRLLECSTNTTNASADAKLLATSHENNSDELKKNIEPKKLKLETENNISVDGTKSPIRNNNEIEKKRCEAKLKLLFKQTNGLINNFGISWLKVLEPEFSKPYFLKLSEFVDGERQKHTIFPPVDQVFSWTNFCLFNNVKVVILGQDPYHGPNQAHGLCFSVRKGVPPPPSLVNIYKELKNDIDGFEIPKHGTLSGWASQGVLLLNACLTVRKGEANSHKDRGWETFTDSVIKAVSANLDHVVFLLWGAYAQKKAIMIDTKKHFILNAPHPSPLSASRGWFGCKHFSKANEYLIENNEKPIDWKYLPTEDEFEKNSKA